MKLKWHSNMSDKPLSFLAWLDLVERKNRHQFEFLPETKQDGLRDRYTRYLIGWENLANLEVGKEFYIF